MLCIMRMSGYAKANPTYKTAHQPIGGLNRARMAIYKTLSAYRHKENKQPLIEPSVSDFGMIE